MLRIFRKKLGIYEENTGLENIVMSWGHDGKKTKKKTNIKIVL